MRPFDATARYAEACKLASLGQHEEARRPYADWQSLTGEAERNARLAALVHNDVAVMAAMDGRFDEARAEWKAALEVDQDCLVARLNRDLVEAEIGLLQSTDDVGELKLALAPALSPPCGGSWPAGPDGGPWSGGCGVERRASTRACTTHALAGPPTRSLPHQGPSRGRGLIGRASSVRRRRYL